jgi:hypothetical protein
MSQRVAWQLMEDIWTLNLPRPLQGVLLALAWHADATGCARPSIARLAWMLGISERGIRYGLCGLKARKLIVEVAPEAPWRAVEYQLTLDAAPRKTPYQRRKRVSSVDDDRRRKRTSSVAIVDGGNAQPPSPPINGGSALQPKRRSTRTPALRDALRNDSPRSSATVAGRVR